MCVEVILYGNSDWILARVIYVSRIEILEAK